MVEFRNKIFRSLDELSRCVEIWKNNGQDIVFTNGCFDIIHPGHVDYLEKARLTGDKLVVAVNSDASVKKLKGKNRPIQSEEARILVLAALASVDAVILFDEDTPINVITRLVPDVLAKGGDYKPEDIVGYQETIDAGGCVISIPFMSGYSTTAIEEKIRTASK